MNANALKPYPHYKPSGVEWLGDVPAHWEVRRLKNICRLAYGNSLSAENRAAGTVPVYGSNGQVGVHSSPNTSGQCLIVGRKGSFGKVHYSAKPVFAIDTTFFVDRRHTGANIRWLYYLLGWLKLDAVSKDSAIPGLNREDAYQHIGCYPPLAEQAAIVRYLDHTDGRIRRYLRSRERLLELLKEYRQAVIHETVTQGLDPDVPLKPSGVEWLGDVPTHWEVRRLRHAVKMKVSNVDKHSKEGELPVRLCNYVDVYKNDRITENMPFMRATAKADEIDRFRLEVGDVLITKDSEVWNDIGVPAFVEYSARDLVCGYHLALLRPLKTVLNGAYLFYALQSSAIAYQFHIAANGVTRYGLSQRAIKSALLPIPPLAEQAAIAAYLDKQTAAIDAAMARAQREINLLSEYRTRLIADVVTGQVDVREEGT